MRPDQPAFAGPEVPLPLRAAMAGLAQAAAGLSERIARNGIEADLASAVGTNAGGDGQKALDVIADDAFRDAAAATGVRFFASEEQDEVVTLDPAGTLALVIDPLDGSSNIDVNVSIGTIFGFYPAETTADASVLRPAAQMLAGGYVIYGPQCCLMVSYGAGVMKYVLDPGSGQFHLVQKDVQVPAGAVEYAINASNYRHWPKPIRSYVDDLVAGAEGPRGKNFNMRWIASLVAETHRIITRGGVFLYPRDSRKGYENGRLRLLYEGGPIAFLMAHAGGAATDGEDALLTAVPARLHARTPLVFGSADKVARVAAYHDLPDEETSALFGKRGLFRS